MTAAGYAAGEGGQGEVSVAGGPGTSQEGEAMALIEYVILPAAREGVYWIVGDSAAAVEALRKYQEGVMSGDGMREFYAQRLGSKQVTPLSAINIIVTPSHWITSVNVAVDRATGEVPTVDLTRALRRHYAYAPAEKHKDHYQIVPKVLLSWLRDRAAEGSNAHNEDRFQQAWKPGSGIRLD